MRSAQARHLAAETGLKAAFVMARPADIANAIIAELTHSGFELPAVCPSILGHRADGIRSYFETCNTSLGLPGSPHKRRFSRWSKRIKMPSTSRIEPFVSVNSLIRSKC
jgi:hypothetical protein